MTHRPLTLARLFAWSVLLLGLSVGCGSGCGADPTPPPAQREMPDADRSSVEASKVQAIRANGKDSVDLKVTVRKADGTPLEGRTVKVTVSGEATTVVQPVSPTDAQGVATATVTSTVAGVKTVTASVEAEGGPVMLTSRPTLEFIVLPASRLAFTTSPRTGTAGAELGVFAVVIQNADGETMTGATNTVTVAIGSGPAAATLKGTVSVAAVNGVARFPALVLEKASQGYTLVASATGLSGATSPAFHVTSAAPASLVVAQVPTTVAAGTALSPEVSVRDLFGNEVTDYTGTVRFTSTDGTASLPGDYTFTSADAGRHVFTGLVLKQAGARQVTVKDTATASLVSNSEVGVVAGPVATFAFTGQPGNRSVRSAFGVEVTLLDAFGNRVAASTPAVTLGLNKFGTLEGLATVTPVDGVASFSGLSIAQDDVGYVLMALADGLNPASSNAFTITDDVKPASPVLEELAVSATSVTIGWKAVGDDGQFGMASHYDLRYSASPIASDADFAAAMPVKQVVATALPVGTNDSAKISGLTPNSTYYVALEVKDNAGNAVRTTRPVSTPFPTPSKLVFLDQPTNGTAGSTQVPLRVAIQDADGLLASNATSLVTLTVKGVAGFGPFYATADKGVATFSDVRIDKAGQGYTLEATSFSLTSATSNPFDIQHGAATSLTLSAEAPKVSYGTKTRATVTVLDAHGNVAEGYTGTVALTSGDSAASLPEAHAFTTTDKGQYTFEPIILRTEGVQSLKASATGLTDGTAEVEVLLGKLMLTGLPATMKAGDSATVTVEVLDGFGARDTGYTGTVHFTSTDGTASLPGDYTFTSADAGRHVFTAGLVLKKAGVHQVTATDTVKASLASTAEVSVGAGSAATLAFTVQPGNLSVRSAFGVEVVLLDAFGNRMAANSPAVTLGLNKAGTLEGLVSVTPVDGVASFSGLSIAQEDEGYVLTASADGLVSAFSNAFTITDDVKPASPVLEELAVSATSVTVGWKAVGDDGLLGMASSYDLRYSASPIASDADFAAAMPVKQVATALPVGTADSAKISGLTPNSTYHVALEVKDNAGNAVRTTRPVSTPFPTPSKLVFLDQPTNGTAGSTQVPLRVAIQDADGLLASNATSLVTLTVKGVAGFGPFYATADKGVATFSDVRIDKAGQGYTLEATSFSLTSATSNPFDIQHGAAASLTLSAEAPKVSYGTKTRATVTVLDAHGNVAEGYTGTVTLSSGDLAASLPEAHAFTATDKGQYTFEPIILRTEGVQTLKASATGLTDGTAEVEVLLGKLLLTGLPATMKAGDSATVTVEVLDGFGVRDTGYTGTVRFTFSDPKGGPLPEYTFTTADLGRKEFTVTVVTLGEQTLKVEDKALSWLSGTASTTVKWGAPVALVLEAPESAVAGNPFSARVTMRDGLGNAVEDYTGIVSFTADATGATVPADYSFTPEDKGSRLFSFTLEKAVSTQLTVTDMALALSGSDTVGVSHSTATRLVLAFVPAPTEPVVAGTGLLLEVTARDAFGNVATGYAGTVRFESTDGQADLPPDTSFAGAKGHKSFSVTLKTAKDQSVSARDVVDTLLSEDASVRIVPGPARKLAFRAQPSSPKVRVAMTSVTVAVTDLYDNTVSVEEPEITVGLVDGNPDAELGGSLTALPSGGLATFSTLTVDQQGVGFRLEAMGGMFDVASSETFAVEDNLAPESAPLSLVRQTSTQVELSWTAVADDGLLGPAASSYDLRYSTSPITEATFASANPVVVGWPQPLGGVESALIKELTASTTYYFALKVVDDAGNASAMSTLSATTNVDPCASVTCTPSAPTCAADGVSLVTPTSTCVVAEDDTTSCQETQKTTACPGPDGVCFEAACDTAPKPTFGTLSISEVMHSPSGSTTEYIELTNNTGNLLNLNGLVVSYTLGSGTLSGSFTVGSGDVPVVVDRKGTFVLAHNQELATNGGVSANYAYDSAMPLEGAGTIKLVNGSTVVEVFTYDSGFPQTMGRSMNLSSAVVGTKANAQRWYWCDSEQQLAGGDFGTPNAPNSTCGITLAPPVDYCAIQYPKTFPSGDGNYPATVVPGSSWAIYSQFYEPGLTDKNTGGNDFYPHVSAELGYGTDATNPAGWTWTSASPNAGYSSSFSNNDEVKATLSIPTAGTYKYGFRYRLLDPFTGTYSPYTYCDQSGAVTPPAGSYGTVTVVSPPPPVLTNHLVISELAPAGPTGANDEFVELHNPTNAEVSLSNWKLQYKAANGAAYSVTYTFSIGAKIPARGYYLLALSGTGYSGSTIADGSYSLAMGGAGGHVRLVQADGTTVVDTVGYGSANAPEGSAITGTLGTSGSYERKAVSTSTAATMAVGGSDATRGNGYDSENNANDFVVRTTRQPQNSASAAELP